MKPKSPKPIPFLKEQQELAAMFEPEKVAHYFQSDASDMTMRKPSHVAKREFDKAESNRELASA